MAGEEASENHFHGKLGIGCPAGKQIVITSGTCEVQVPAQTARAEVEFTNEGLESTPYLGVHWNVSELEYTKVKDGVICPLTGTGSKADGKYQGDGKMEAKQGGAAQGMQMGKEVETMLREEKVKNSCKKPIKAKTLIKWDSLQEGALEFVGNATEIECFEAKADMRNEVEKGIRMKLKNFSLSFLGCSLAPPGKETCPKVEMTNNNPNTVLTPSLFGGGGGVMQTSLSLFLECEGKTITCEYESKKVIGMILGGFPGEAIFIGQAFDKKALGGGMKEIGCSNVLLWNQKFTIREPAQLYVTQP